MEDIFSKLEQRMGPLGMHADDAHGYFTFPKLEGPIAPRMMFRGSEKLTWSLNNYLGLANHPEVLKADAEAAQNFGMAADGSPSKEGSFYAVSLAVPKTRIYETVKELRKNGGSGVLTFPLTYVFDEEPPRWSALINNLGLDAKDYEHLKIQ